MLRVFLVFALLATCFASSVYGQTPADPVSTHIEGDVVWDTPHELTQPLVVDDGSSLTIRGTLVNFANNSLRVEPNGKLVVESFPGAPATIRGGGGWSSRVFGRAWFNGTPEDPVLVYGIGGFGSFGALVVGGPASMVNAFVLPGGWLSAHYTNFRNYTSGIYATEDAGEHLTGGVDLDHVEFSSKSGAGLLVGQAHFHLSNATFSGLGANVYGSYGSIPSEISNVTFDNATIALAMRDHQAVIQNVSISHSIACLAVYGGGARVRVDSLSCDEFGGKYGITSGFVSGSSPGNGTLDLSNITLTSHFIANAAIQSKLGVDVTLDHVALGPLTSTNMGLAITGRIPPIHDLTFVDVKGYDVEFSSPEPNATLPSSPLGTGAPGKLGWLVVDQPTAIYVRGPGGQLEPNATLTIARDGVAPPVFSQTLPTGGTQVTLDRRVIAPDTKISDPTYDILATHGNLSAQSAHYVAGPFTLYLDLGNTTSAAVTSNTTLPGTSPRLVSAVGVAGVAMAVAIVVSLRRRA